MDACCLRPKQSIDYKSMHSGRKSMQTRKDEDSAQCSTELLLQWLEGTDIPVSETIEISNFDSIDTEDPEIKEKSLDVGPEVVSAESIHKQLEDEPIQKIPSEKQDATVEEKPAKVENKSESESTGSRTSGGGCKKCNDKKEDETHDKDSSKEKDRKSPRIVSVSKQRTNAVTEERNKSIKSKRGIGEAKPELSSKKILKSSSKSNREKCKTIKNEVKNKAVKENTPKIDNKDVAGDILAEKENEVVNDNVTNASKKPPPISKLGRIPKKSSSVAVSTDPCLENLGNAKKKAFSVGIGKDKKEKPKTVRMFCSKIRSTGLETEIKPPAKPIEKLIPLKFSSVKRSLPPKDHMGPLVPSPKKLKLMDKVDLPDIHDAIKFISPKPKAIILLKSEMLHPRTWDDTSPLCLARKASDNLYPLTEEKDEKSALNEIATTEDMGIGANAKRTESPVGSHSMTPTNETSKNVKGILLYCKKTGTKRTVSWRNEGSLVEIRYFQVEGTEKVVMAKSFGEMAKLEILNEKKVLQLSRKLGKTDHMKEQIAWRVPFIVEQEELPVVPGEGSFEKAIMSDRENGILQTLHFDKSPIPEEPDRKLYQICDPIPIPLEDPESETIDWSGTPWPETKVVASEPTVMTPESRMQPISPILPLFNVPPPAFRSMPPRFGGSDNSIVPRASNNFVPPEMVIRPEQSHLNVPPPAFQSMPPRFGGPDRPIVPVASNNIVPPEMVIRPERSHLNVPPPAFQSMPPRFEGPDRPIVPEVFNNFVPPEMVIRPEQSHLNVVPVNDMMKDQNMFSSGTVNENFMDPKFPNGLPNNFHNNRGGGGVFRGGNGNNRGKHINEDAGNWRRKGSGGQWGGRLCRNVQNHGYCRNMFNCSFVHP